MGRVIGKKHVRHGPVSAIPLHVERESVFLLKTRTPYVLAIKRISKMLEKFDATRANRKHSTGDYKRVKYVAVKAMGRAISLAVLVGLFFEHERRLRVEYVTGTVLVLDEFTAEDSENDEEDEMRKRAVSCLEVRVWLGRE